MKNDHTCLFHCINACRVPRTMFDYRPNGLVFKQRHQDPASVKALKIPILSHDVAPGSDITPCNKIDKPLVVYRFSNVTE